MPEVNDEDNVQAMFPEFMINSEDIRWGYFFPDNCERCKEGLHTNHYIIKGNPMQVSAIKLGNWLDNSSTVFTHTGLKLGLGSYTTGLSKP